MFPPYTGNPGCECHVFGAPHSRTGGNLEKCLCGIVRGGPTPEAPRRGWRSRCNPTFLPSETKTRNLLYYRPHSDPAVLPRRSATLEGGDRRLIRLSRS